MDTQSVTDFKRSQSLDCIENKTKCLFTIPVECVWCIDIGKENTTFKFLSFWLFCYLFIIEQKLIFIIKRSGD